MKRLQDLRIHGKILVITLTICGAVLSVAILLLMVFQIFKFRASFERDTVTLVKIIANNSTAALAFDDRKMAEEILGSLKAEPTVVCAFLVNTTGVKVAHYGQQGPGDELKLFPAEHEFLYRDGHLLYTDGIELEGKHIGNLCLRVNYRSVLNELLRFYGVLVSGVLLISVLLAVLLTRRMQTLITDPLLNLAETSRQVGERNDYSVRSPLDGRRDEIGVLAQAFNHMLSRIHRQDAALNLSQQKLESLVNSIDGIVWEWNPHDCLFTFVSRQSERILGYLPDKWLGNPGFWQSIVHADDLARATAARLQACNRREPYNNEYRLTAADGRTVWIRESGMVLGEVGPGISFRGMFEDITGSKNDAVRLEQLNRQLINASRQAGMAEVATGVLHNVGNVLNSVNVSANLLIDQLGRSHLQSLMKALQLLREHSADTLTFLTQDPRGMRLMSYLIKLGDHLQTEQFYYKGELDNLSKNIEHIKEIVSLQQGYARTGGITEVVAAKELVEEALLLNKAALIKHGVTLVRDYADSAPVAVDKHKALQILVNLIRNAKQSMVASGKNEKFLTVSVHEVDKERVRIKISDNGLGIPLENLTCIFQHGFTTKKDGHGFGLHCSANAAKEMGGTLAAHSEGADQGAFFTLDLPAVIRQSAGSIAKPNEFISTSENSKI